MRCRRAPALSSVPSLAGCLRGTWAPSAFVVSFKLETDEELLVLKAHKALQRYGVHAVVRAPACSSGRPLCTDAGCAPRVQVANELLSRTQRVLIVTRSDGAGAPLVRELQRPAGDADIERVLVDDVARLHDAWRSQPV